MAVAVLLLLAVVVGGVVWSVVANLVAPVHPAEVVAVSGGGRTASYEVRFRLPDGTECVSNIAGSPDDVRVGDTVDIQYTAGREPCATARPYGFQTLLPLGMAIPPLIVAAVVYTAWRRPQVLAWLRANPRRVLNRRHRALLSSAFRETLDDGRRDRR
ncbi:hypothetical protein R8Z50_19275 [Longispora sp. K20-0274]|uniref:hypothetical protein n=1 Tax=Longispora sp. K20-0274 TaxID=3088255 RepID=UPI00399B500F